MFVPSSGCPRTSQTDESGSQESKRSFYSNYYNDNNNNNCNNNNNNNNGNDGDGYGNGNGNGNDNSNSNSLYFTDKVHIKYYKDIT